MRALAAVVATLWLPAGGTFSSVRPAGNELLLSGYAQTGTACIRATVDPVRLKLLRTSRGPCPAPRVVYDPRSFWAAVVLGNGRAVFRFQSYSDTQPEWAFGPGALWVYDVNTDRGPELARVSLASGRVVQRVRMPKMFRPLLAADLDGAWLVPATNGGLGDGSQPQPLLHVALGATRAEVVHRGGRAALWLLAHGHTVWMEQIAGRTTVSLWRFDGTKGREFARPGYIAADAVWGAGSLWVAGADAHCTTEAFVRVDPDTGRATRVARVKTGSCEPLAGDPHALLYSHGALFFLDEPWLHRIEP